MDKHEHFKTTNTLPLKASLTLPKKTFSSATPFGHDVFTSFFGTKTRGAVVGDCGKLPFSIRHDDIHIHLVSIEVCFQQEACSNDRFGFDGLSTSTFLEAGGEMNEEVGGESFSG